MLEFAIVWICAAFIWLGISGSALVMTLHGVLAHPLNRQTEGCPPFAVFPLTSSGSFFASPRQSELGCSIFVTKSK
jgi:hypothetical protein